MQLLAVSLFSFYYQEGGSMYHITSLRKKVLKNGTIKGTILVAEDGQPKKIKVYYEQEPRKSWEQWGAHVEVLYHTQGVVEALCSNYTARKL